jgi:hypothetical protein
MDEKLLILLGLGSILYLATSNSDDNDCDNDDDNNDEINYDTFRRNVPQQYDYFNEFYESNSKRPVESFQQCGQQDNQMMNVQYNKPPVENFVHQQNESPLLFGNMVQENYIPSDYHSMNDYNSNDSGIAIPVYDEKSGNVLPIGDMTDMAAGENNKYIYDRTIGSIGFTSTKIGGRRRGQADYIRGDLPILPDKGAWFQVSADVTNTLLDGALNVSNGIGNNNPEPTPVPTSSGGGSRPGAQFAIRKSQKGNDCDDELLTPLELEKCLRDDLYTKQSEGQPISMRALKTAFSSGLQI